MRTIQARWVFPATSPPIPDGQVSIAAGKIVRVGGADPAYPVDLDLGAAAVIPGFVNAHTHLELGPIPWDEAAGPEDEVEWLGRVIRSRSDWQTWEVDSLILENVQQAVRAGTTAIADITTAGRSWSAVAEAPVWGTVFAEVLGLSPGRSDQTFGEASAWLASLPAAQPGLKTRPGLSPHAPYSTDPWLYQAAAMRGLPLATHLGEMPAEHALLADRGGPLRDFLEDLGAWVEDWQPAGPSPVDYLDFCPAVAGADWVIAHGNIFDPAEVARLALVRGEQTTQRIAVAYCPRTHARFGHPPHPFRAMLAAGLVVCLGTDSLASTPTLSILDELRFLRRHHPDVAGETLLRMATIHGAWALRHEDQTGSLEPGKSADLVILPQDSPDAADDPHNLWLDDPRPPLATMFRGAFVAGQSELVRSWSSRLDQGIEPIR